MCSFLTVPFRTAVCSTPSKTEPVLRTCGYVAGRSRKEEQKFQLTALNTFTTSFVRGTVLKRRWRKLISAHLSHISNQFFLPNQKTFSQRKKLGFDWAFQWIQQPFTFNWVLEKSTTLRDNLRWRFGCSTSMKTCTWWWENPSLGTVSNSKEIACGSFETIQIRSCSTRLILPSWRAGTIPITKRLLSLFPPCSFPILIRGWTTNSHG